MNKTYIALLISFFLGLGYFFGEIMREGRDEKTGLQYNQAGPNEKLLKQKFRTFDNKELLLPLAENSLNVINFWATWCPPCKKEIPIFNKKFLSEFENGIGIIGIAMDEENQIKDFLSEQPIKYPNFFGHQEVSELMQYYGNSDGVLPFTVFTDNNGRYLYSVVGELSYEKLSRVITDALKSIEK